MKKNKLKILLFLDHCLTVFASLDKNGGQAVELEKEDDGVLARSADIRPDLESLAKNQLGAESPAPKLSEFLDGKVFEIEIWKKYLSHFILPEAL